MASPLIPQDRLLADESVPGGASEPGSVTFNAHSLCPERREQIEELLGATEEELLRRLGRAIAPLDQIAATLWFVSGNGRFLPLWLRLSINVVCRYLATRAYVKVAERFLRKNRSLFRLRICIGWDYARRRSQPDVRDRVQLVATLTGFVSHLTLGAVVPCELVAVLLVKKDLDKLCRCKPGKVEAGTP
jgi:hypothetical protein